MSVIRHSSLCKLTRTDTLPFDSNFDNDRLIFEFVFDSFTMTIFGVEIQ